MTYAAQQAARQWLLAPVDPALKRCRPGTLAFFGFPEVKLLAILYFPTLPNRQSFPS